MELFITNIVHVSLFHLILKQIVNLFQTTKNLLIILPKDIPKDTGPFKLLKLF